MAEERKYRLRVEGHLVEVTKDVYLTYYRVERHTKTLDEKDVRNGKVSYSDLDTEETLGEEMVPDPNAESVEDKAVGNILLQELRQCLAQLPLEEQNLIRALYFEELTERMSGEELRTDHHDVGFAVNCSFGNGYRFTHKESYRQKIITGAASLLERFDEKVGCIKSWNTRQWGYTVIIDNMMNLELLAVASHLSGDSRYVRAAESHANVTMRNHFRPDGSSYHVVGYDVETGKAVCHATHQGLSDESSWARGQAWALYGYTMLYRMTGADRYLKQAEGIADLLMSILPRDGIPYWDFDAPNIPDEYKDASAGAIMASALIELSQYIPSKSHRYISIAEKQIRTLCSPEYLAPVGSNGNFILKHSVGSIPAQLEVDVPLTYADYYFVEALIRMNKLLNDTAYE